VGTQSFSFNSPVKKVILDENIPVALRLLLTDFDVVTVQYQGWSGIQNGALIALIDGQFDVFLTADQNFRYQQNLSNRRIAIVEVPFIQRKAMSLWVDRIRAAIFSASPGDYIQIPSDH
jgi:hypothetical protein